MTVRRILQRKTQAETGNFPADMHPLLRRIYIARGLHSSQDCDLNIGQLYSPALLGGLQRAVDVLEKTVRENGRFMIVADFDADGATSCALVYRALHMLGAKQVDYVVPNRFEYGYGLTPEIVAVAAQRSPDLIITVDNGVSSVAGVAAAKAAGIQVVVTDHHLPGDQLPDADAIVNPNLVGEDFPSKNLAGVGVAFYVMLALRARLRETGWFEQAGIKEPNLARVTDLVALGTVADVVPLDRNNRILVQQGVNRIRQGHCAPGILALLQIAKRDFQHLAPSDLGYAVAPRLNAAGRLEDMSLGIECLLTDEPDKAAALARELDNLNHARREIEADMQAQAMTAIKNLNVDDASMPRGLCLFDPGWHQGVIGILAGRIKERYHRPVIAFADNGDGELKGSARSIAGFHIRDGLDAVATGHAGLISKFGGHAMAAGLSLPKENLEIFKQAFDAEVRRHLDENDLEGVIQSDGELEAEYFNLEVAEMLRNAGPWGQGFPEPVFDGRFGVIEQRVVGQKHLKLRLRHPQTSQELDGIAFNQGAVNLDPSEQALRMAYRLDVNRFRGMQKLQLMVEYIGE